ncbi:MBL fold metallo-hydrolase [Desulfovibrio mangrovi]|uniref:MBL fold metallo-hydrolase n=1 Tax=Desulfovibrio mangrovi TaxID=2976983 RepID=UPI002246A4FB|nr:MBL fold metallo-hydrolase [Desulfovibrio mangrovi]UZP66684.1 MBL fold metallo-hydrolase [Desulfovibrio mangrovi]
MSGSRLSQLTGQVQRIDHGGLHVDLVRTSKGTVRIGSMPDIAKFLKEHGFREETVVVPDWEVSLAGDNRTGEEFILWHAQVRGGLRKEYVGLPENMEQVQHHLGRIFPYFFDEKRLSIVRKKWLGNWFHPNAADPLYRNGDLEIRCGAGNIVLADGGRVVYDRTDLAPAGNADDAIEALLATVPRDGAERDCLEVIPVGCGNGFHGTVANTVVRYGRHVIWIDPCGYPAHALARHNIHWDDITHFLFTHSHEDHVQGFTVCVQRARKYGRKLNLLVTDSMFRLLLDFYTPLFPDLKEHVNVLPLHPATPLQLGPVKIESRWNHHILPYGTLGLKISAGGRTFGYSGDTKYDEAINRILNRKELTAEWFAACDLVFHEIDFDNPHSVHTHWKQVESLQRAISGRVLGYHTPYLANSPFPLAEEGRRYVLDGGA